jgi:hypothetical protein
MSRLLLLLLLLLLLPSKLNNCLLTSQPKSYQLLLQIFRTGFRALVGIGQKLFSKMSPKAGYQEIFAEFIEGAKQSPAQWYSIKPLQNGIPSLVDLWKVGPMQQILQLPIFQIRKLSVGVHDSRCL